MHSCKYWGRTVDPPREQTYADLIPPTSQQVDMILSVECGEVPNRFLGGRDSLS